MTNHHKESHFTTARITERNDTPPAMIGMDRDLPVGFAFIQDPPEQCLAFRAVRSHPSESRYIDICRWQVELLHDLGGHIDAVDRGTVYTFDLILLDDLKALGGDPVFNPPRTCPPLPWRKMDPLLRLHERLPS